MKRGFVVGRVVAAALVGLTAIHAVAGHQAHARTPDIFFAPTLYSVADAMLKMAQGLRSQRTMSSSRIRASVPKTTEPISSSGRFRPADCRRSRLERRCGLRS
jgi:hypothetical protein